MKRANAGPPTWCAFESETDYVAFGVGTFYPRNIDQAATLAKANSDGRDVIEPISADGWTFAARWPADGKFVRVQWWLADSKNSVLECKMGSDRGLAGINDLGAICEQVKAKLYTP